MKASEVVALEGRLDAFVGEMTGFLGRKDRQRWARTYLPGLLLDGERKSVEAMAARLGIGARGQALQGFVSESPWSCDLLQAQMTRHTARLWPRAAAWILDETSFPKAGRHSVGVAPQCCGALGKIANCQVAVSLHYAGQNQAGQLGTAALGWRLFLPRAWTDDPARRQKAGVPADLLYASKNALALALVEEALARGLPPAPVLADSDYGDDFSFRARLRALGVGYCVAVQPRAKAWTSAPAGSPPPAAGRPAPREPLPTPQRLDQIARELPPRAWRTLTWREGSREPMQGRFARVPIWASHGYTQRQHRRERTREWLFIEWPRDKAAPTDYWLLHLGSAAKTPTLKLLAGLARERWLSGAGLPRVERRARPGPLRGPLLAGLAPPRRPDLPGPPLLAKRTRRPARRRGRAKKPGPSARVRKLAANPPPPARPSRADVLRTLSVVRQPVGHLPDDLTK